MAERLERLHAETDTSFLYANALRVEALRGARPPPGGREGIVHRARLAHELLRAGRTREAIDGFREVLEELGQEPVRDGTSLARDASHLLAVAYVLLAERENCVEGVGTPACLVPTPPDGVHTRPEPARNAARAYRAILERDPGDLGAAWMLNIAHMMLGGWPDSVPERWRIPAAALAAEHDPGRFPDMAPRAGADILGHAGGSIVDDFDGDGLLDIVASSWLLADQLRYLRNAGDGTFRDRTREAALTGITGGLNLLQADYDNDGHTDVLVLRGGWLREGQPNSLLRNRGDGTFEDITEQAGLLEPWLPTQTAAWGDFDGDGWLDLFVGNESWGGERNPCQLFRNNRDGTFTDVAREAGAAVVGVVKAVLWGDYDNDGRPDLYLSRRFRPNLLLRNEGPDPEGSWRFRDVTLEAGVPDPVHSFPAWFWDFDNDGWLDLFVSGYDSRFGDAAAEALGLAHRSEVPRLYRNDGDGTFSDVTAEVGLDRILFAMGANFGDLDNDGWLDLYGGTGDMDVTALVPNRMLRNAGGVAFQEVTAAGGFGHIGKGHGISFADVDNDGDQDVHAVMGGALEGDIARNVLFRNPGHGNRWIVLSLEGVRSNRSALGARIRVSVEAEEGPREVHRVVASGGSFGANPLRQEIGLGRARRIREVAVTWPATGETDVYRDLEPGRAYRIREGDTTAAPLPFPPVSSP